MEAIEHETTLFDRESTNAVLYASGHLIFENVKSTVKVSNLSWGKNFNTLSNTVEEECINHLNHACYFNQMHNVTTTLLIAFGFHSKIF